MLAALAFASKGISPPFEYAAPEYFPSHDATRVFAAISLAPA